MFSFPSRAARRSLPGALIALLLLGLVSLVLPGCSGGGAGGGSNRLSVELVTNGFPGPPLIPHQIFKYDELTGQANRNVVVEIRTIQDLLDNVRSTNPVLAPSVWRTDGSGNPMLPNGQVGNHFLLVKFSTEPNRDSIFDPSPSGQNTFGMLGTITISRIDNTTGAITPVPGRGFLGGFTPDGQGGYVQWVAEQGGRVTDVSPNGEGAGFPGVASAFNGDVDLVAPASFVFIPDGDQDLSTFESYGDSFQVRLEISTGVTTKSGRSLLQEVVAAGAVNQDQFTPEAIGFSPQNGASEVNPTTDVELEFTEPVQPLSVGQFPGPVPPGPTSSVTLSFGPQASRVQVPFTAMPAGPYNLARYTLDPIFAFPGRDPLAGTIQALNEVTVQVNAGQVKDLVEEVPQLNQSANFNVRTPSAVWTTGDGPGLVNAPVAPSVVYVGRLGAEPAISVIDLYGFGQSTGDPSPDDPTTPNYYDPGNHFIDNPNLVWGANIVPPLSAGTSTIDGGSAGVFTLTRDTALNDRVVRAPLLASIGDIHMGWSLDRLFNNAQVECLAGGGNICAATGPLHTLAGTPIIQNTISVAPHPNPPKLLFPPICLAPFIQTEEPTTQPGAVVANPPDLLGAGDPFGKPSEMRPPTGLIVDNDGFLGPVPSAIAQGQPGACQPYGIREQIGHFLYVIDRVSKQIKVFNSNRMNLIDEIDVPDPTDLAITGNMKNLAVTNFGTGTVSIIDIDPWSTTFHQVVKSISVGNGPLGCAFHSENEDLLVASFLDNSVTVIRQMDFTVRKTITNQVNRPIDVAVTPRQVNLGFNTGIYFAYILNQVGTVAVMESGPDGTNGIGYDDVIGLVTPKFPSPQSIQVDPTIFNSAVYITHVDESGRGIVSNLQLTDSPTGPLSLSVTSGGITVPPSFRDRRWQVVASYDFRILSNGFPSDTALDNLTNVGVVGGLSSVNSNIAPAAQDGKTLYRIINGAPVPVSSPRYLFIANPSAGVVDVINLTNQTLQLSIPASGAAIVSDYWRQ